MRHETPPVIGLTPLIWLVLPPVDPGSIPSRSLVPSCPFSISGRYSLSFVGFHRTADRPKNHRRLCLKASVMLWWRTLRMRITGWKKLSKNQAVPHHFLVTLSCRTTSAIVFLGCHRMTQLEGDDVSSPGFDQLYAEIYPEINFTSIRHLLRYPILSHDSRHMSQAISQHLVSHHTVPRHPPYHRVLVTVWERFHTLLVVLSTTPEMDASAMQDDSQMRRRESLCPKVAIPPSSVTYSNPVRITYQ